MHDRRGLGFGGLWPIRPFLKPLLLLARGALAADLWGGVFVVDTPGAGVGII